MVSDNPRNPIELPTFDSMRIAKQIAETKERAIIDAILRGIDLHEQQINEDFQMKGTIVTYKCVVTRRL